MVRIYGPDFRRIRSDAVMRLMRPEIRACLSVIRNDGVGPKVPTHYMRSEFELFLHRLPYSRPPPPLTTTVDVGYIVGPWDPLHVGASLATPSTNPTPVVLKTTFMNNRVPFEVRIYHPITGAAMESGLTFEARPTIEKGEVPQAEGPSIEPIEAPPPQGEVPQVEGPSIEQFEAPPPTAPHLSLEVPPPQSPRKQRPKPQKRVRRRTYAVGTPFIEDDPRKFLDVEAQVSSASEEDEEEDGL
ncbi:hypothetical protein H0H92_009123, partial [Tricholoma furcatifolium]